MKKFYLSILAITLLGLPACARTIEVEALSDFSTKNPPKYYSVKLLGDIQLEKDLTLNEGDILEGEITDVTKPKRLKRDASFSFVPLKIINTEGNTVQIKETHIASYTTILNKGQLAKSAALTVGNHFVKGISVGVSAIEGAVKNEEDNRLKSSAIAVYESTPISYVEKGQELNIKKNQIFYLKFDEYNEKDEPNYEFTPANN